MPSATVNGCDLYYELSGGGPDLVFIHGETHGIELFEEQIPHFSRRHRCLVYDRRGHGKSQLAPYGYSLWNQTLDLAALLDHLAIQRAVLVAVAMATPIAVTFAMNHPEKVRGMVLASWYELDGYPLLERRREKHRLTFAQGHLKMHEVLKAQGRQGLIDYIERQGDAFLPILPVHQPVRGKIIRMFASHQPEHYIQSVEYYTSLPNLVPQMGMIECPVLGVCGEDDPSPDNPDLLQHVAAFNEVWIKGARRFTPCERPEEFNKALDEFLPTLGP